VCKFIHLCNRIANSELLGSADKTIKLWHQHKNIHTFHGHTDAVRGLAIIPDIGFASCSNDR
jgi:phospholipase A-2-activating protein